MACKSTDYVRQLPWNFNQQHRTKWLQGKDIKESNSTACICSVVTDDWEEGGGGQIKVSEKEFPSDSCLQYTKTSETELSKRDMHPVDDDLRNRINKAIHASSRRRPQKQN